MMMTMMMMVTVSTSLSHCCTLTSTLLYALVFASCILVNVSGDKKPWSHDEQSAVLRHLAVLMSSGSIPGKAAIDRCIASEPVLKSRPWTQIKDFCRNSLHESTQRKKCMSFYQNF